MTSCGWKTYTAEPDRTYGGGGSGGDDGHGQAAVAFRQRSPFRVDDGFGRISCQPPRAVAGRVGFADLHCHTRQSGPRRCANPAATEGSGVPLGHDLVHVDCTTWLFGGVARGPAARCQPFILARVPVSGAIPG